MEMESDARFLASSIFVRLTFVFVDSTCVPAFHSNDYHYKQSTHNNVMIHMIINSATDNAANTSILTIKCHSISNICVVIIPNR